MPTTEQRMWTVVRKLPPPFTLSDVEQVADVDALSAKTFVDRLNVAGYVTPRADGYALVKDTGPMPPEFFGWDGMEDGNTGEVHVLYEYPAGAFARRQQRGPISNVIDPVLVFLDGQGRFTLADAVRDTGLERRQVLRVLDRLVREGRLELVDDARQPNKGSHEYGPHKRTPAYCVIKDAQPMTPRQRRGETVRDRLWRSIRTLRRFTRPQLADASGVSMSSVEDYTAILAAYGYLALAERDGRQNVWVIRNDPGPCRPVTPEVKNRRTT